MRRAGAVLLMVGACGAACGDGPRAADVADSVAGDSEVLAPDTADAPDALASAVDSTLDAAETPEAGPPPYLENLASEADFAALAGRPGDASIPGIHTLETVIDRADGDHLYFTNVALFPVHFDFCRAFLSGHGLPPVFDLGTFNTTEYYTPQRRFLLGALSHVDATDTWFYELAPYDTANATMLGTALDAIQTHAFFGAALKFHPTSSAIEVRAAELPTERARISTPEFLAAARYQPLSLATTVGRLRFVRASDVSAGLDARTLPVLDALPASMGIVAGAIASPPGAPLGPLVARLRDRSAPLMLLAGAWDDPALRALDGAWVSLTVGAFDWELHAVSEAEADAWAAAHPAMAVVVPPFDPAPSQLLSLAALFDPATPLTTAFQAVRAAYGGSAAHLGALARIGPNAPLASGFAVPIHWYQRHLAAHGLDAALAALVADPAVAADRTVRETRLAALRSAIVAAPLEDALAQALAAQAAALPSGPWQVAASTNAEDLPGLSGAGLAHAISVPGAAETGDALKAIWASLWELDAYDERAVRGIDQTAVGMGVLVTAAPDGHANGVALSADLYDLGGIEPAFVVEAQSGTTSVVTPPAGVTSDRILYYWYYPGQPQHFLAHTSLAPAGAPVLGNTEAYQLGRALDGIHTLLAPVDQRTGAFYGVEVGFRFIGPPGASTLVLTSARPHSGWGH